MERNDEVRRAQVCRSTRLSGSARLHVIATRPYDHVRSSLEFRDRGFASCSSSSTTITVVCEQATMHRRPLKTDQHYVRFTVDPPCTDGLTVRKTLQDALLQSFGLISANTYIDILWVAEDGREVVIRVNDRCVWKPASSWQTVSRTMSHRAAR